VGVATLGFLELSHHVESPDRERPGDGDLFSAELGRCVWLAYFLHAT
jgi:hypothetical protein